MQPFPRGRWTLAAVFVAAVLLPLVIAGCITIGAPFRYQAVELIERDRTTDQEILKMLGNPIRTGVAEDGLREWTYAHYRAGLFTAFEGRDLVLKFNADGTVRTFGYRTTDPGEPFVQPR